jgi:hypothetical protein
MANNTFRYKYQYIGNSSTISQSGDMAPLKEEEWEATLIADGQRYYVEHNSLPTSPEPKALIADGQRYYVELHNIDQDFRGRVHLSKELFEKLSLCHDDIAEYTKTVYQEWLSKQHN